MLRNGLISCCLSVGVLLSATVSAFALRAVLTATEMVVITNPNDSAEKRVLARYEIPERLASARVIYAQLNAEVDATLSANQGRVEVEAVPVTSDWTAGTASWSTPWTKAGGDFDAKPRGAFFVLQGVHSVRINVTDLVTQWAKGQRRNIGLAVKTSSSFGGHFSLPRVSNGDSGARQIDAPTITVWYLPQVE